MCDWKLSVFNKLDSTNNEALRRLTSSDESGEVILAYRQTMGKGRAGREWVSCCGNLMMTATIAIEERQRMSDLAFVGAVAVAEAVNELLPHESHAEIKWPNDLMVGNRKLGGLLIEVSSRPLIAALGIGLNLKNAPKSDNFQAACLLDFNVSIKPIRMSKLIAQKLGVWIERWSLCGFTPVINQWKAWGKGIGEIVRVRKADQTIVEGKFIDIDKEGRLLLELSNGRSMTISAGDVLFE